MKKLVFICFNIFSLAGSSAGPVYEAAGRDAADASTNATRERCCHPSCVWLPVWVTRRQKTDRGSALYGGASPRGKNSFYLQRPAD